MQKNRVFDLKSHTKFGIVKLPTFLTLSPLNLLQKSCRMDPQTRTVVLAQSCEVYTSISNHMSGASDRVAADERIV